MTILSIQINTEYWDYRQCCNLPAAVPWGCVWCGRIYANRGHATYSAGIPVCQAVSYPQACIVACNIVLAAAGHRVYTLRTVRLWSQCAVISVPDTAHHTTHKYTSETTPHTNLGPRHSTPHTTFGPRHGTPHTTFGPRHGTPHTTFGPRHCTTHTTFGPRHGTPHTSFGPRHSTAHTSFGPRQHTTHQFRSETRHTNQFLSPQCNDSLVSHHPQMCVLQVHQPLDQTTFTCTPSVFQNHSINIT